MPAYPQHIQSLIDYFARFPGIGEKSAQRFVFFLLRQPAAELMKLAKLIMNLPDAITVCAQCHNYSDKAPCFLCASQSRDQATICVVAASHNVASIERTGEYRGTYHVLHGTLNILEGVTPDKLKIRELVLRVKDTQKKIREVILAFNPDLEGESTMLYLSKILKSYPIRVTRLAQGLPRGADIEYADDNTLSDALRSRRELQRE
ncbi:recombination protein RecR [Candidatus Uhrbacteria bacterium]|nr:recombination protein RecR [Candidatus Uhrbacteria bacterium]